MALNTKIRGLQLKDSVYGAGLIRNPSDGNVMDIDFATMAGVGLDVSVETLSIDYPTVAAQLAGIGLVLNVDTLDLSISELPNGSINQNSHMPFATSPGGITQKITMANFNNAIAGNGMDGISGLVALDLDDLSAAVVDEETDSIAIIDATDGSSKKESIVDLVAAIAGDGLAASLGKLSVTSNITESDLAKLVVTTIADQVLMPTFSGGTPVLADSVQVFLNGLLQEEGVANDYTLSAIDGVVTFAGGGYNVTATQPEGTSADNGYNIAISEDGQTLLAGIYGGRLFLSTNGGTSYVQHFPNTISTDYDWRCFAVGNGGQALLAGQDSGNLYYSGNGGTSWTDISPVGSGTYRACSMSQDGEIILVTEFGSGAHVSTDHGQTWGGTLGGVNESCEMNDDGSIMFIAGAPGRIFRSTNQGTNWIQIYPTGGSVNKNYYSIGVSNDGQTILVGTNLSRLYLTTNGGSNWAQVAPVAGDQNWRSCDVSGDGQILIANEYGSRAYISKDNGGSWNELQPAGDINRNWVLVEMSDDAQHIVIGAYGQSDYILDDPQPGLDAGDIVTMNGLLDN